MLRAMILMASRSAKVRKIVERTPISRQVVRRFVVGETIPQTLQAARTLAEQGLTVSLDYLGEENVSPERVEQTKAEYLLLLESLSEARLAHVVEISLKLSALGLRFDEDLAFTNAEVICLVAKSIGTTVTFDMEDHTTTDATLRILMKLRKDIPGVGAVVQAYLHRTEGDCQALAGPGSRVRLCKGAYREPASLAFQTKAEISLSYQRCMEILMSRKAYPMLATHDPHLISLAQERAQHLGIASSQFEFQMLYGVRPKEQVRLAQAGYKVRVYVPYGTQWYGYLMRRLAERSANVLFLARALVTRD